MSPLSLSQPRRRYITGTNDPLVDMPAPTPAGCLRAIDTVFYRLSRSLMSTTRRISDWTWSSGTTWRQHCYAMGSAHAAIAQAPMLYISLLEMGFSSLIMMSVCMYVCMYVCMVSKKIKCFRRGAWYVYGESYQTSCYHTSC